MKRIKQLVIATIVCADCQLVVLVSSLALPTFLPHAQRLTTLLEFVGLAMLFAPTVLAYISVMALLKSAKDIQADIAKQRQLNALTLLLKLGVIPFFVLNFLVCTTLLITPFGVAVAWIGYLSAWLMLVPTSLFAVVGLSLQYNNRRVSFPTLLLHGVLQFIFVVDVMDFFVVHDKIKWLLYAEQRRQIPHASILIPHD
ncbi:MAG: hypothetical protein LBN05_07430 [Oscillospiraceae bacterium]|jgi:hypothetical protein|nr:hypothetical protein [Oscillospiraceae bacterium]